MNTTLQQILNEALEDEYKARAMYRKVIDKFGPERPFINGVVAEIDNMTMYERLLVATKEPDVACVLSNLQAASRDNHLPAFQRGLESGRGCGQTDHNNNIGRRRRRHGQ